MKLQRKIYKKKNEEEIFSFFIPFIINYLA